MTAYLLLLLAIALVLLCGVFVAAEFALVTVDRSAVEQSASAGDRSARGVQKSLRLLSSHLSGAQIGITITNLGIGWLAEPAVSEIIRDPLASLGLPDRAVAPTAVIIGLVVSTVVTMVFGELVR
jgi:CBS domain containing-hemolysin-like protein